MEHSRLLRKMMKNKISLLMKLIIKIVKWKQLIIAMNKFK